MLVTKTLTIAKLKALKPRDKNYRVHDGGGLYLEVSKTGGKWWRLKYYIGSKEKRLSLGVFPGVSLSEARLERDKLKKLIAQGEDPSIKRKLAKTRVKIAEQRETQVLIGYLLARIEGLEKQLEEASNG